MYLRLLSIIAAPIVAWTVAAAGRRTTAVALGAALGLVAATLGGAIPALAVLALVLTRAVGPAGTAIFAAARFGSRALGGRRDRGIRARSRGLGTPIGSGPRR